MTPSIYDYRDNEIEAMREIEERKRRELVEAVVCTPILVALVILMIFI